MRILQAYATTIFLIGLSSCSSIRYFSWIEARNACREWESKEKSWQNEVKEETADWIHLPALQWDKTITARYCRDDRENSVILGYENREIQNETFKDKDGKRGEWSPARRFRY